MTAPGRLAYNAEMARVLVVPLVLLLVSTSAAAAASPPQQLVSYARSGGFIGVHDSVKVFRDGGAASTRGAFRLSARRLHALEASLRRARFATLQARYEAEYPVADGFLYRVAYAGRTVVVEEEANPPVRLRRVLDLLADILARRG